MRQLNRCLIAVPLTIVSLVSACGDSDNESSALAKPTTSTPAAPVDHRPRVEGKWRVVFTPRDESDGDEERVTWTVVPKCPEGPCGARIKSSSGAQFNLRFDDAIGDYQRVRSYRSDCANSSTDEVVFKDAYLTRSVATLQVVDSLQTPDGTNYAAELTGKDVTRSTLKKAAAGTCSDESDADVEDVRMVRIDLPAGRKESEQAVDQTTPGDSTTP